jgi:phytoene desaturase
MNNREKKIAVVGAGVGGLSAAARLAHRGCEVTVFEKLSECGGRNHMLVDKGFKFDMGPSFVLMPDFFNEVFTDCGKRIEDYLRLKVLDINYKIFYPDHRVLTVFKDSDKTKQELEKFEVGSSRGFDQFIKKTERFYNAVAPLLYQCFTSKDMANPKNWKLLLTLEPFTSYWQLAKKFFKTEELAYAFTFEAMFMGVSPFEAPGFYSVITYADHVQKIAHPMGGMYEIPKALERLAQENGARFFYNAEVQLLQSKEGRVSLFVNGEEKIFDKVVVNADYCYTQSDLLRRSMPDYRYSCSVFLLYLGLKGKIKGLDHHNLFFANDLRKNLREIFTENKTPQDPSFYVHVPTVTDPSLAPEGKDIAYILIPVSNLKDRQESFDDFEESLKRTVFKKMNAVTGQKIEDMIEIEHKFYPQDFITRYNIKYGATFGLAHNLMQSAFFRPANQDSKDKNIYYVGASTQPGGGLPVVIAGSKIVADMITS